MKKGTRINNILIAIFPHVLLTTIIVVLLFSLYGSADISYPLTYSGGDDNGVFYVVKTISEHGINLENPDVGGFSVADMYDYYECNNVSFSIIKIISFFTSKVYLITNVFYFFCFILAGNTAYFAASRLLRSKLTPYLVGILYAFTFFIQARYGHMWLCCHFMMPLSSLVAIHIARGEVFNFKNSTQDRNKIWGAVIVSVFAAGTGLYYAFFTCMIYGIAFVINWINSEEKTVKAIFSPLLLILATMIGVIINLIPNIIYFGKVGFNMNSQAMIRSIADCEIYGLKLVQMILPRQGHRIEALSELSNKYQTAFPLVNENVTVSLGIIGTIGLFVSFVWLLNSKKKDKTYSYFIIGVFLIGTVGGFSSLLALILYTPMRCYNRSSILILFFCLLSLASLFEKLEMKMKKILYTIFLLIVISIGFLDQTAPYSGQEQAIMQIDNNRKFIRQIESFLDDGDYVFELPVVDWPSEGVGYSLFNGYLDSDKLRWSYGAAEGRDEAVWQKNISSASTERFVSQIKEAGYKGLYLDKRVYAAKFGEDGLNVKISEIDSSLGDVDATNEDGNLMYWNLY